MSGGMRLRLLIIGGTCNGLLALAAAEQHVPWYLTVLLQIPILAAIIL